MLMVNSPSITECLSLLLPSSGQTNMAFLKILKNVGYKKIWSVQMILGTYSVSFLDTPKHKDPVVIYEFSDKAENNVKLTSWLFNLTKIYKQTFYERKKCT